jgi:hypothetical protein
VDAVWPNSDGANKRFIFEHELVVSNSEASKKAREMTAASRNWALTARDARIFELLTRRVLLATAKQLARGYWPPSDSAASSARERLRVLVRIGLLEMFAVRAHPELSLDQPVWSWKPGEPLPPCGSLSYRLRTRWAEAFKPIQIFTASERLGRRFAGRGGCLNHPLQATHDLHVTTVYLHKLKVNPAEASAWVSDAVLAPLRRGQKLPDAEIHDQNGRTIKVIEFGGSYPPERLRKVHDDCEIRQVPYELW